MSTAATRYASGTPQCPRQGKCSCRAPQIIDFKLRWRLISTRQLTEALPKARQGLVFLRSTPTSTQRTRPVQCHPAATHHANGAKYCPRQGKCSNCIAQYTHFKPRWRRISTRQLTEALPKARQGFLLRLAAHQLQRSAPIWCNATPPQLILPAEPSTAQGKARQVLMLLPAAHQLQATLASNL